MKIVCLCGSTRFQNAFEDANYQESLAGNIVLTVACFRNRYITEEQKAIFDRLHFAKIDLAHEILVLNVGGYIGLSTQNEINYAERQGKRIRYLEPI